MTKYLPKCRPFQVGLRAKSEGVSHHPNTERWRGALSISPLQPHAQCLAHTGAPHLLDEVNFMKPSK